MLAQDCLVVGVELNESTGNTEAESFCLEQGLPGRIIPVPREITAGCGLAWRAPPEAETLLTGALGTAGLAWSDARVLEV